MKRKEFITIDEAAKLAKVSPRTIYRWIVDIGIDVSPIGGLIPCKDKDWRVRYGVAYNLNTPTFNEKDGMFVAIRIKGKTWIEYNTFTDALLKVKYGLNEK